MKYTSKITVVCILFVTFIVSYLCADTSPFSFDVTSVKEIDINLVCESLNITQRGTDSIEVIIKTNKLTSYDPEVSCVDGRLVVIQRNGRLPIGYKGTVEIHIPSSFAMLEGNGWIIRTVSGSVEADALCAKTITIGSISGAIRLEETQCLDVLDVSSISGAITTKGNTVKLIASSKSGTIRHEGAALEIYSDNASGSITMNLTKPILFDSSFETVSGAISIVMPEHPGFTHHYKSTSGSIRNDFTGFSGNDKGVLVYKSGQVFIETRSVSGSVQLEKK